MVLSLFCFLFVLGVLITILSLGIGIDPVSYFSFVFGIGENGNAIDDYLGDMIFIIGLFFLVVSINRLYNYYSQDRE